MTRTILLLLAAGLVTASALGARTTSSPGRSRNVPCDEIIDLTRFPHWGNAQPQWRNRLVLNSISVPPAFIHNYSSDQPGWPYFSKWGIVVRSDGRSVTLTVPPRWRDRLAIDWGNNGHGVYQVIRLAGCKYGKNVGNAYAGGFYLRSRSACVPLTFRVGDRTATLRFGIGRRCS